jgi:hypothetical protein
MQRTALGWILVTSLGLAALVGCAVGSDVDDVVTQLQAVPVEAGESEGGVKLPPSTRPTEDAGSSEETDGGTTVDDAGEVDAGKPDSGNNGGPTCASPNACTGATDLGSLSGDTGTGARTAQGSGSQWFKVRFTEDDSGLAGVNMLATMELKSPAGTNFDLYVYVPGNTTAVECSAVTKSATSSGTDIVSVDWGEGIIPNGASDDRNVIVEVRWKSGTCAPTAKWTLTVRGNN